MTADTPYREGGCRCGAVRFRAAGKPLWVAHCHCNECRKATGSAFASYAGYRSSDVKWTAGPPKTHETSPGVHRGFCGTCGSPMSFEGGRWPDEIHLFLGAFDDPAAFEPRAHVYVAEAMPWAKLADGLKRFARTSKDGPPLPP